MATETTPSANTESSTVAICTPSGWTPPLG